MKSPGREGAVVEMELGDLAIEDKLGARIAAEDGRGPEGYGAGTLGEMHLVVGPALPLRGRRADSTCATGRRWVKRLLALVAFP